MRTMFYHHSGLVSAAMAAAVSAGLASSLAHAENLQPTPIGDQVNILGLRPGQTPDQVRAILLKADADGQILEGKDTDPNTNQPYVSQIKFVVRHPDPDNPGKLALMDVINVVFSAPASGNITLNIHRNASYFGATRPLKVKMRASLEEKYGRSPDTRGITYANEPSANYVYDANGHVSPASDPAYLNNCRPSLPGGSFSTRCGIVEMYWVVFQAYAPTDPDRTSGLKIDLRDNALAVKALGIDQAAVEQKRLRDQSNATGAKL